MKVKKEVYDYALKMQLISLIIDTTFDFANSITVSTELKNGNQHEVDVKKAVKDILDKQIAMIIPYEMKDIHINMFVYDDFHKLIYYVVDIQDGNKLLLKSNESVYIEFFEKNRFYRVNTINDLLSNTQINEVQDSRYIKVLEKFLIKYFLDVGYRYFTRDKNNDLAVFKEKPLKNEELEVWNNTDETYIDLNMFNDLFSFVKWEDEEPYIL